MRGAFFAVLDADHNGGLDAFEIPAYERERVPEIETMAADEGPPRGGGMGGMGGMGGGGGRRGGGGMGGGGRHGGGGGGGMGGGGMGRGSGGSAGDA